MRRTTRELDDRIAVLSRAIEIMWSYRGLSAWWRRRQLIKEWNELVAQRLGR